MRSWTGIAIIVALVLVSMGAALAANGSAASATAVATGPSGLGRIVVDGRGHTLYLFEKDRRGTSRCAGLCATYWPPLLTSGKSVASKGARRALLGTIRRADGAEVVALRSCQGDLNHSKLDIRCRLPEKPGRWSRQSN